MAIFDLLDEYEQIQLRIIVTLENMPAPVITTVSELSRLLGASEFCSYARFTDRFFSAL
ncbi:hypothetical protein [Weissella confusa]|uniref:hypothetical protein n=1 Tax=Weissella confusa TaxID=1583 RepID=UPI00130087B1|nr:hypothetical protein [Weissella confusa]